MQRPSRLGQFGGNVIWNVAEPRRQKNDADNQVSFACNHVLRVNA